MQKCENAKIWKCKNDRKCHRFEKTDLNIKKFGWFHGIYVNSGSTTQVSGVATCFYVTKNHFTSCFFFDSALFTSFSPLFHLMFTFFFYQILNALSITLAQKQTINNTGQGVSARADYRPKTNSVRFVLNPKFVQLSNSTVRARKTVTRTTFMIFVLHAPTAWKRRIVSVSSKRKFIGGIFLQGKIDPRLCCWNTERRTTTKKLKQYLKTRISNMEEKPLWL